MSGSISYSFDAGTYDYGNVFINIHGKIKYIYHYSGNSCSIRYSSEQLSDVIESLLYKFINTINNLIDMKYHRIDFFGDVRFENGEIVSFPLYFILSGEYYCLYVIDPNKVSNISLLMKTIRFESTLDSLSNIEPNLVKEYWDEDNDEIDDEYDDIEDNMDGNIHMKMINFEDALENALENLISGTESNLVYDDMDEDIYGTMNDDIHGDMNGNIYGTMNGDIHGDMDGDIHGIMNGDIHGDMDGDIYGTMNGNIYGDMFGDIEGYMKGIIEGKMYGKVVSAYEK